MSRAEHIRSSTNTDERVNNDIPPIGQGDVEFSALASSVEQYFQLIVAQFQQTKHCIESQLHLALRALLMSVMALLAFIIVSLCLWFSISALVVIGLVSLGVHWLIATFTVLLANVGVAWYLLLTSRDLRNSIKLT